MTPRIAFIHDWLVTYAGAERVLEAMLRCFPEADLFSLVDFLPADQRSWLGQRSVTTSFLQKWPFAKTQYRKFLPFMPTAIEQFELAKYDIVISSSYAVAKGVITGPDQLHLCMCFSPMRYAWDLQGQYLRESHLESGLRSWMARSLLHRLRVWDVTSAARVDGFIAISKFVQRRIRKFYRRDAAVIYPPVDVDQFVPNVAAREDFYLTASRMVSYKMMPLIVKAFAQTPQRKLVVIGDGPDFNRIKKMATPNITLLGRQPFEALRSHMQRARAFVFAAEEDFGIVPLEAQACGTPVVAYGKGGATETLRGLDQSSPTAVFFFSHSVDDLKAAIDRLEASSNITASACRENAERFNPHRFDREFTAYVNTRWEAFQRGEYLD